MQPLYLNLATLGLLAQNAAAGITAYVVSQDDLYRLDLQTAQVEFVAAIDQPSVYDLALASDGRLFAQRDASDGFFEIDPLTGIGSAGIVLSQNVRGMDLWGSRLVASNNDDQIVEIDASSGALAQLATVSPGVSVREMAFGTGSTLYATDANSNLHWIDAITGGSGLIASLDVGGAQIRGIDFVNGSLYAVTRVGALYSIDVTTGDASYIGDTGLAPTAFAAIPSPASLALLGAAGAIAGRRRR